MVRRAGEGPPDAALLAALGDGTAREALAVVLRTGARGRPLLGVTRRVAPAGGGARGIVRLLRGATGNERHAGRRTFVRDRSASRRPPRPSSSRGRRPVALGVVPCGIPDADSEEQTLSELGRTKFRPAGVRPGRAPRHLVVASPPGRTPYHGREGRGDLPPDYRLEEDPDLLVVRRPDGSLVAAFGAGGFDPPEVSAAAWEDHG